MEYAHVGSDYGDQQAKCGPDQTRKSDTMALCVADGLHLLPVPLTILVVILGAIYTDAGVSNQNPV